MKQQHTINAERIDDSLIQEAAQIRVYQDFCNDFSLAQHVWHATQEDPASSEDLVAKLIHGKGFRPQLYAAMVAANSATLTPLQLRRIYQ